MEQESQNDRSSTETESKREVSVSDLENLSKSLKEVRESIIRHSDMNFPFMDMIRGKMQDIENKINQIKG